MNELCLGLNRTELSFYSYETVICLFILNSEVPQSITASQSQIIISVVIDIYAFLTLLYGYFNPFPNKPWFLRVYSTSLLKTLWEKEKLLVTSNFSFSHSVFYPFGELSAFFIELKIVVCKLFQFG